MDKLGGDQMTIVKDPVELFFIHLFSSIIENKTNMVSCGELLRMINNSIDIAESNLDGSALVALGETTEHAAKLASKFHKMIQRNKPFNKVEYIHYLQNKKNKTIYDCAVGYDPTEKVILELANAPDDIKPYNFVYLNHASKSERRFVIPINRKFYYGTTEYYKELQWLLEAWDLDREGVRIFAVNRMNLKEI